MILASFIISVAALLVAVISLRVALVHLKRHLRIERSEYTIRDDRPVYLELCIMNNSEVSTTVTGIEILYQGKPVEFVEYEWVPNPYEINYDNESLDAPYTFSNYETLNVGYYLAEAYKPLTIRLTTLEIMSNCKRSISLVCNPKHDDR